MSNQVLSAGVPGEWPSTIGQTAYQAACDAYLTGTGGYSYNPLEKIGMRLGLNRPENGMPYTLVVGGVTVHCATKLNSRVAVFVSVRNETAMILDDDPHLFPSDAFITKLRLLMK